MKPLLERILAGLCLCFFTPSLLASGGWTFNPRIAVTAETQTGVYHHLDGAGRKHIALSSDTVAAIWEDDHSADPQVYLALKQAADDSFSAPLLVSSGQEAYEPSIAGLSDNRFVALWEQDAAVYARAIKNQQMSLPLKLSTASASHVSVSSDGHRLFAAWREQRGTGWSLWVAALRVEANGHLSMQSSTRVESSDLSTPLLFPTLTVNEVGLTIAWEDRSDGHTRLKYSFSADNGRSFSTPVFMNEFYSGRNEYDKGNGVTRVSMASFGQNEIVSAWMDKRDGSKGYAIYAALGSGDSFGPNEKVQARSGDELPHYNPATAGNRAGDFVVAWDDFRAGDSDIWVSRNNEEWGQEIAPAMAAGKGEQTHASVALDEQGGLHLLWIERAITDAPTRLWYSFGNKIE